MTICALQPDVAWHDKPANHAMYRAMLAAASPPPGSLVVLPEMCDTGFSMDVAAITDTPGGATAAFLAAMARESGVFILGGLVTTAADGRGLNQAAAFSPDGREIGRYTKNYRFPLLGEPDHFAAGVGTFAFVWAGLRVCPVICYDLRFPELFRSAGGAGEVDLYCVIANWPTARVEHWTTLLRARAIENQAYVVGVNRVGRDPNVAYPGRSLIIDPSGTMLADAGEVAGVASAEVGRGGLEAYRAAYPFLASRWRGTSARG